MRPRIYDDKASKSPVTMQINGDLYAKAKAAGLDVDTIAERALDAALRERVREEIRQELEVYNEMVDKHGSFADAVREHYASLERNDAV